MDIDRCFSIDNNNGSFGKYRYSVFDTDTYCSIYIFVNVIVTFKFVNKVKFKNIRRVAFVLII